MKLNFFFLLLIFLILFLATALWVWEFRFYSLPKKEISFYKGLTLSMNASESDLDEAKELGANIVEFVVNIHPQQEGGWQFEGYQLRGAKTWQEHLIPKIKLAYQKGLQVTLSAFVSFDDKTKDPQEWLTRARPLYEDLGKFAAKNKINLIFVPGEIEVVTGATCCSQDPQADLVPTANNELSAKGFVYWSEKIARELKNELRKNFQEKLVAVYLTGNWWYENEQLVGIPIWDIAGFDAIISGLPLDGTEFDQDPSSASRGQVKEIKEIAKKSGVETVMMGGPLVNSLMRIQGKDFEFSEEKRKEHYNIFFEETHEFVNGYFIAKFPPTLYDPVAFEVAKNWFKKL